MINKYNIKVISNHNNSILGIDKAISKEITIPLDKIINLDEFDLIPEKNHELLVIEHVGGLFEIKFI